MKYLYFILALVLVIMVGVYLYNGSARIERMVIHGIEIDKNKSAKQLEQFNIVIQEFWNNGDYSKIKDVIGEDYTLYSDPHDPWDGKTIDHKTYIQRLEGSRAIFPDQRFEIEDVFISEDKIAANWTMTGTHMGALPGGMPATHKKVKVPGMTVYYFKDGLVIGHWQVFDRIVLMSQLK